MERKAQNPQQIDTGNVTIKRKTKWIILVVSILVIFIVVSAVTISQRQGSAITISPTDTALLVRTDLQDSISVTGTVESAKSMTVYSTMAYTVQEVFVDVGDRVQEGQLLCKLDDQNIQDQIETQEASLAMSTNASNATIASAKDSYEQFKSNLENGLNTTIISAENAVTNAYNAYTAAQQTYDRYLAGLNAGENTTLLAQETTLRNARNAVEASYKAYDDTLSALETAEESLETAEEALEDAEDVLKQEKRSRQDAYEELEDAEDELEVKTEQAESLRKQLELTEDDTQKQQLQSQLDGIEGEIAQLETEILTAQLTVLAAENAYHTAAAAVTQLENTIIQCESAYESAQAAIDTCQDTIENAEAAYETAQRQYHAAMTSVDNMLVDYAKNVETTFQAYETAKTSLQAAKTSAENQLQTYKNNLNSAYANANKSTTEVTLRQLQADLASTEITAPMTGTVTAVYAEVGSAGSGLLFIIEDTENFVISTDIKDYDIASVELGTQATISSDATGEAVYEGVVSYIAPTATKTPAGVTDTSGDITFAADVKVNSKDTKLRIGLNVRLNLIVAEEKGALSVPYEAVYTNSQGQTCLLAAEQQIDGLWILREYPVETGLETYLDIAVKSNNLMDGMTIISSPEQYLEYLGQHVVIGNGNQEQSIWDRMGGS